MSTQQEKLLTAGQFAKMHGIPKRTLMYYDDIGLMPAYARGENQYRYYSYRQSPTLEIILSLRELDVSIEEIREYMDRRSPETLIKLLEQKIQEADGKIRHLTTIKELLQARTDTLRSYLDYRPEDVTLQWLPEEPMYLSRPTRGLSDREATKAFLEHAAQCHTHQFYNHSFGVMVPAKGLMEGDFLSFDHYYTKAGPDCDRSLPSLYVRPAGRYLAFCHKGGWDTLGHAYRHILDYARSHGLRLSGYAFEEGVIDEMAIASMDDYVTRIVILAEGADCSG